MDRLDLALDYTTALHSTTINSNSKSELFFFFLQPICDKIRWGSWLSWRAHALAGPLPLATLCSTRQQITTIWTRLAATQCEMAEGRGKATLPRLA